MPRNRFVKYVWGPLRDSVRTIPERDILMVLSLVVGICCGLAAVTLKSAIHFIRHVLTSWIPQGSAFNLLYIVLPGIGMLLAMLLVRYLIRDNIGHGVTKVLVAVSKNESKIAKHNMWSSMVTSALTIGFGGSVGAEAPIVYTGAAIGSNLARYMGLSYRSMTILLGCGAAGAVAGIFNAPLAGILFTLEILLFNISMTSILPLLLSTVSATIVSYICLGQKTQFECTLQSFALGNVPFYIILGLFCGFVSLYFLRMTLHMEDRIGKFKNPYLKWFTCAALLGLLIYLFPPLYGEGYDSLFPLLNGLTVSYEGQTSLAPLLHSPWGVVAFFALVLVLKVFAMTFTNAGGGVGGTFGPTLFVGALSGFVMALTINIIAPGRVPVSNFVLVGMAGTMAGVMQAPMTAIFLIAEISGGYELLIPLIITATISYAIIRYFEKYSIYTKRIANTGELLTHDSDQAVLTLLKTSSLVEQDFSEIRIDASLEDLVQCVSTSKRNIFPVVDSRRRFQGYVSLEDIRRDMFRTEIYHTAHVYNYMRSAPEYVLEDESMESVMHKFEKTGAWNLPVITSDRIYVGFVSRSKIFNAYREQLKTVSQD